MKKFFAALLTIFIVTVMCGETSLTVLAKDSKTEKSSEARPADKEDLIGKWYKLYDNDTVYTFDEKGYVTITYSDETETGKYTVKDGLVTMKLTSNDKYVTKLRANGGKYYTRYMAAVAEDGFLLTCHVNKTDNFKPYETGQSVSEYFKESSYFFPRCVYLSKEKPVKANQKDILGTWVHYSEQGPTIYIFEEKKTTAFNFEEKIDSCPIILKNGHFKAVEELPEGWSVDEDSCVYLCRGKIFNTDSFGTDVLEKYTPRTVTKNIFNGTNYIYQNGEQVGAAAFKNGKGKLYTFGEEAAYASYSVKDKNITLNLGGKSRKYAEYYIIEYNDSEYGKITYIYLLKGDDITAVINVGKYF